MVGLELLAIMVLELPGARMLTSLVKHFHTQYSYLSGLFRVIPGSYDGIVIIEWP